MTGHESKELFRQYCRPGGPLSRQNGERMKQYVSRRRRCWTLRVEMDPVIHFSQGRGSGKLLDLSGLTREERVMVQASISTNAILILTVLLTPSSVNIHVFISEKVRYERRAMAKTGSNVETIQTLVGFAEKARANTQAAQILEQVLITRTSLPLKITIIMTT